LGFLFGLRAHVFPAGRWRWGFGCGKKIYRPSAAAVAQPFGGEVIAAMGFDQFSDL
jgi:hypothetical protein